MAGVIEPSTHVREESLARAAPSRARRRFWPRVRAHRLGVAAIAWSALVLGVQGARLGRWIIDDAGISFAYARSLAAGHGPVVQAGASPVEGYSNPSWVALLAMGKLFGLFDRGAWFGVPDYVLFPKVLALLCGIGIVACFYAACVVVLPGRRVAALVTAVAGTVLAFVPTFVIWAFSGLENSLYALLVMLLAVVMLRAGRAGPDGLLGRRVAVVAGVIAALAALTRPDGIIYVTAFPAVMMLSIERRRVREVVAPAGFHALAFASLYGSYVLWRRFEFGRWLPNTAVAKTQAAPSVDDLNRLTEVLQYPGPVLSLVALAVVTTAVVAVPAVRPAMTALLVPLALALASYCVLNPDWMGQLRFSTPVWPPAVLATSIAAAHLLSRPGLRRRVGLAGALTGSGYLAFGLFSPMLPAAEANPVVPLCVVAAQNGELFNAFADIADVQHGSLLLPDLGGTALTSRLHLRDTAGLVDADIADLRHNSDSNALRSYIFDVMQPTFIQTHGAWSPVLMQGDSFDPRMSRDYAQIYPPGPVAPEDSSDWIRKSALKDSGTLAELRAYARSAVPAVLAREKRGPNSECTARLRVGQVPGT